MSISMKSSKAQMYSEIERLRAYCDQLEQQLRAKPAAKPAFVRRSSGFQSLAQYAPAACKHFGVKSVTREQIQEYVATLSN